MWGLKGDVPRIVEERARRLFRNNINQYRPLQKRPIRDILKTYSIEGCSVGKVIDSKWVVKRSKVKVKFDKVALDLSGMELTGNYKSDIKGDVTVVIDEFVAIVDFGRYHNDVKNIK